MATESNERRIRCEYCDEEFEEKDELHEHLQEEHGEKSEEAV